MDRISPASRRRNLQKASPTVHGRAKARLRNTLAKIRRSDVCSSCKATYHRSWIFSTSSVSKFRLMVARKPLSSSITSCARSKSSSLSAKQYYGLTFTTSTGSLFMLFGQVSSGRFSGSPGRNKILSRFFTSSMTSFAAFESSRRSLRSMSLRGSLKNIEDLGVMVCPGAPSADDRPERVGVGLVDNKD